MRSLRLAAFTLLLSATAVPASVGQELVAGDAAAGASLYQVSCMSCHGSAGNSLVPEQPVLAGQHAEYTAAQIRSFKSKDRVSALMQPFVDPLSDEDIDNISVYLEGQQAGLSGAVDADLASAGESLYRNGIPGRAVPNCTGCHGPAGKGIPPLYPRLSGQHAAYTVKTLTELRDGTRPNAVMRDIAAGMTDADIAALAEYIAGLH